MRISWLMPVLLLALGCSRDSAMDDHGKPQSDASDPTSGVTLSFIKAEIGPITWEEPPKKPLPRYLKVWIKTTAVRKFEFTSWAMSEKPSETYVEDEFGKKYPVVRDGRYAGTSEYTGTDGYLYLSAKESVTALLLFESPQGKATKLTIRLGGSNVQAKNDITLAIKNWK